MSFHDTNTILFGIMILLLGFTVYNLEYVGFAVQKCIDGDGDNKYFKGSADVYGSTAWDVCVEGSDIVQEFFCERDSLNFKFYTCLGGCDDGKCMPDPSESSETTVSGDEFTFGNSGDQVEINEYLGDVQQALTSSDLDVLDGGRVSTKQGATDFNQYLRFGDEIDTGKVVFAENENDLISDFLHFSRNDYIFEYELEFNNGFESNLDGTSLTDLEGEKLIILGREYTVVDAEKNGNNVEIDLVGGDYSDIVYEGDKTTYKIGNKDVAVEIFNIDDVNREVTLNVDGELSKQLGEGDVLYIDGVSIAIEDIFIQESADGKDFAKLFVSAKTIRFKDDASDSSFSTSIKINQDAISAGKVRIKGNDLGASYELISITYRLQPDSIKGGDVYVAPGKGVREYIDEPDGFLAPWNIIYGGLEDGGESDVIIDPASDQQYDIRFSNVKGDVYKVGAVYNNGGSFEISDGGDTLHFIEGTSSTNFIISERDYVILTSRNDKSGITNIVRYDSIDTAEKTLMFDELSYGSKTVSYTGTEGVDAAGDLIVSGKTYRVYVGGGPDYKLAADMDSDGDVDGSEVNVVVQGGGLLDLGASINPIGSFVLTLTTQGSQFDESVSDEAITINVLESGGKVDLSIPTQASLSIESDNENILAMSNYGVHLEKDSDDPDRLVIKYPHSQSFADVRIVFSPETIEQVAGGASSGDCGNGYCNADEGYMNCPEDCKFAKIEEPKPVVKHYCGDGVCDNNENSISCPSDCAVYETPEVVVVTRKKGFWQSFWEWITGVF